MKKQYISPELEAVKYALSDVIVTSVTDTSIPGQVNEPNPGEITGEELG